MRPPRIPNLLSKDSDTIYFLTLCVSGRARVLDNDFSWATFQSVWRRLDRWEVLAAVAMPDHLHILVAPLEDRDQSLSDFLKWFKRWFNAEAKPKWKWMGGGFDRLLRGHESVIEKWEYLRENPVRAGLVEKCEDWPYQFTKWDWNHGVPSGL